MFVRLKVAAFSYTLELLKTSNKFAAFNMKCLKLSEPALLTCYPYTYYNIIFASFSSLLVKLICIALLYRRAEKT